MIHVQPRIRLDSKHLEEPAHEVTHLGLNGHVIIDRQVQLVRHPEAVIGARLVQQILQSLGVDGFLLHRQVAELVHAALVKVDASLLSVQRRARRLNIARCRHVSVFADGAERIGLDAADANVVLRLDVQRLGVDAVHRRRVGRHQLRRPFDLATGHGYVSRLDAGVVQRAAAYVGVPLRLDVGEVPDLAPAHREVLRLRLEHADVAGVNARRSAGVELRRLLHLG